jgi:hypothetical protein
MKTTAAAVIAALVSFLIGCVWVLVDAEMFVQYFYAAQMVALTHLFTLGWVSLMIVGVLRQLAPVAFGANLKRPGLIGAAVAAWIPGLAAMIFGFRTLRYTWAAAGTIFLFSGVLTFVAVLLWSLRGIRREPPHNHLIAALLYFAAAAFFGLWMALSKAFDIALPAPFHRVLFAHIHLAGAGWAGMMIFAVMSRLFPQPHLRYPIQARTFFVGFHLGLIGLVTGLLAGGEWHALFGSLLAVTCLWYAGAYIPVLREFAQPADQSTTFLIAAWVCLGIVACLGLWFSVAPAASTVFSAQLQFVYGFLYMFGWLSFMILGMLYRIMPTHISKIMTARGITATAGIRRSFIQTRLQIGVLLALVIGLAGASFGILFQNADLFRIGWSLWLAGIGGFLAGLVRAGLQLRRLVR